MEFGRHPGELQLRKSDATSNLAQPVASNHKPKVKDLSELHVDSEDYLQRSRPPSMTDGSSRTSSVYSTSDHRSAPLNQSSFAEPNPCPSVSDTDNPWLPLGDENNVQRHRTESPSPSWRSRVSRRLKDSNSSSTDSNNCENVQACCPLPGPSTAGVPLGEMKEDSQSTQGLPDQNRFPQSHAVAICNAGIEDVKTPSRKAAFLSKSTKNSSESEEDSGDDVEGDDDNWSGANDYLEAAIYQAAFPDLALAAHLISEMYSMLLLGSSKKVSRKVSSWRERIASCAGTTVSGTTSTEKAVSSNGSSSALRADNSKRDRLSNSTDSNIGEEEDDGDDDSDESRRKRLKENNFGSSPTQRLACPFNKMDASKYGIQLNQEGKGRYRTCAGPGFRSIQILKEHLKRNHYPVQCERCYRTFKVMGNSRSSAVAELAKHHQLDEICLKGSPSMKEGISDAQWVNLIEEKQCRKGKAAAAQTPKSDVDKWKDIWGILFPQLPVPLTPWYDTSSTEMAASSPSQGLRPYLKVYEQTLNFKLHAIKGARSDEELASLLLEAAGKAFEVWSATRLWNEALSLSLSNSGGSGPLSSVSWENIPKRTPSLQQASPKKSTTSVFPNLELGDDNSHAGAVGNFPTGHTSIIANLQDVPQSTPYPVSDITTGPQGSMQVSGDFEFVGTSEAEFPTFPSGRYHTSTTGIGGHEWLNQVEQMQAHAASFDMGVMSAQIMPRMPHPQWDDHYHTPNFGRFGGGP